RMLLLLIWMMMVSFKTGSSEDLLKPLKDELMALEGDTVTLSCKYSGSIREFFWYQQKSSSSPQFLIKEYSDETEKFSVNHNKQQQEFHLQISSAAVTDSAVYYCAVEPTRWLPVILVLSRFLFRFNREKVCSRMYVELKRLNILFVLSHQRELGLIQTLMEVREGEKLMLTLQRIITLHFNKF
uniref:Ig-like domain-containing protein n=1 Tax=Oryzias latipes TaxID=8090 RepID=A0A3B3HKI7_ORYLA